MIRTQREEYRDVIDVKGRHLLGCRGTRWYRVRESVYERVISLLSLERPAGKSGSWLVSGFPGCPTLPYPIRVAQSGLFVQTVCFCWTLPGRDGLHVQGPVKTLGSESLMGFPGQKMAHMLLHFVAGGAVCLPCVTLTGGREHKEVCTQIPPDRLCPFPS